MTLIVILYYSVITLFGYCSQIIINKEPTDPPSDPSSWVHYNMKGSPLKTKEVWDVKRLLEVQQDLKKNSCNSEG